MKKFLSCVFDYGVTSDSGGYAGATQKSCFATVQSCDITAAGRGAS